MERDHPVLLPPGTSFLPSSKCHVLTRLQPFQLWPTLKWLTIPGTALAVRLVTIIIDVHSSILIL